jgi:hypothetical protein
MGAYAAIDVLLSIFSPQFTKYSNSFLFEVTAALLRFYKTSLENRSFAIYNGASALASDAGSAPCKVKRREALKSPKYDDI